MGVCQIACHTCHACQRDVCVNVPNACQLLIFTCERAIKRFNVQKVCQLFNLVFQRAKGMPIFQLCLQKGVPVFQLFFKRIFRFLNFSVKLNIWTVIENLSRETKNLNFDICEISLRKNLVNLKPLTSFSIEHVGLCKMELNVFFCLLNFICCV